MILTETRKEIINLISKYMDKTLSKWCCFRNINDKIYFDIYEIISFYDNWDIKDNLNWWNNYNRHQRCWVWYDWIEIIWHYDITAVLKYIKENTLSYIEYDDLMLAFHENWKEVFYIPNKPLYLYTEQEDKELLELLKSLSWL